MPEIELTSSGISPDIYFERYLNITEIDSAFSQAFQTTPGAVFAEGSDFEQFLTRMENGPAALLYRLERPHYGQKINIYTDKGTDLFQPLAHLATWLGARLLVDLRADERDDRMVLIESNNMVLVGHLAEAEPIYGDGSSTLVLRDLEGHQIPTA